MAYLTERKLSNTLDIPVNLPATEIKMGDWIVIATISLVTPAKLTYQMMNLNFISSTFALGNLTPYNLVDANGSFCYVGLYLNYVSGSPGTAIALDLLKAGSFGVFTRTANPVVTVQPGTYSWIAVNNIQYSDQNALLTTSDSADFTLCCTGQGRIELDLSS